MPGRDKGRPVVGDAMRGLPRMAWVALIVWCWCGMLGAVPEAKGSGYVRIIDPAIGTRAFLTKDIPVFDLSIKVDRGFVVSRTFDHSDLVLSEDLPCRHYVTGIYDSLTINSVFIGVGIVKVVGQRLAAWHLFPVSANTKVISWGLTGVADRNDDVVVLVKTVCCSFGSRTVLVATTAMQFEGLGLKTDVSPKLQLTRFDLGKERASQSGIGTVQLAPLEISNARRQKESNDREPFTKYAMAFAACCLLAISFILLRKGIHKSGSAGALMVAVTFPFFFGALAILRSV